ncbi:MAG: dTDP-4-dehydrorhamnose reductase [Acidobacteriota bacterium]|jgi:dTDP-4-dehydrorhamnose reductase|nr:dTDP-4-dehydrorhamnose reductase [Acidobacteriota bacterium]
MRTLVLGGTGMLGRAVVAEARSRSLPVLGLSREQADIRDRERLLYWIDAFRPELIVNCAAYTKVDACEGEGRVDAFDINAEALDSVVAAAREVNAWLLHVSTDYVFDGKGSEPYPEDGPTGPLSVYGQTKLDGERRVLAYDRSTVVRTSWLFGPGGSNFVATIVRLIEEGKHLRVVRDQEGAPTYTLFLARAILDLALLQAKGVVHYRNREPVSWYAFASEIAGLWSGTHRVPEVVPIMTTEFPRPAPRPAYSVLDVSRFQEITGRRVEPWGWGLAEYLTALRKDRKEVR